MAKLLQGLREALWKPDMPESDKKERVVSVWVCSGCKSMLVSIAPSNVERNLEAPGCRTHLCTASLRRMDAAPEARIVKGISMMVGPVFVERRPNERTS